MKHYLYEEQETVFSNVQILIYVFDITSDTPEEVEVYFYSVKDKYINKERFIRL